MIPSVGQVCVVVTSRAMRVGFQMLTVAVVMAVAIGGCRVGDLDRESTASSARPNVILVTIDALRADHVRLDGGEPDLTPRLAVLARESIVFTEAVSSFVGTTASMPSLMTGLYPSFEGIPDWNSDTWNGFADLKSPDEAGQQGLTDNVRMLAEIYAEAGYATAGFNTNPFLSVANNFDQGFEQFEQFLPYLQQIREHRSHDLEPSYPPADVVIDKVEQWLDRTDDRPFFLWLHLMDPHSPYLPPAPFDRMFLANPSSASDLDVNRALYHLLFAKRGEVAMAAQLPSRESLGLSLSDFARHARGLYRGEVRFADTALGALLDRLRDSGVLDGSVLVVTADHGEEFFEHGHIFHELSQPGYEEVIRIPLLIRLPGARPTPGHVDQLVRMVDIAPTLLDLTHLESQAVAMDGRSLLPMVAGVDTAPRAAFISAPRFAVARTAQWKYRRFPRASGSEMLFRIEADPLEAHDVADEEPDALADMRALWAAHAEKLVARATRIYDPSAARPPEIDAATRQRLEALGYTE